MTKKITMEMYLQGRDTAYPMDYEPYKTNARQIVDTMNKFLADHLGYIIISSGFRPARLNNSIAGAAKKSNHIKCLAIDIKDLAPFPLMKYVLKNLELASELGIYFEDFRATPSWVHCQIVPPGSGRRIFKPNSSDWLSPNKWSGDYEDKYNNEPNS